MSDQTTLAVDVGGTFTDAVVSSPAGTFLGKTPTTSEDQSAGVIAAARQALAAAGIEPNAVTSFVHGMTVTTNALLEGKFARTALITTAGFTDLEELARQDRPDLYRLGATHPAPVVPADLRFGLDERCGPDGVIRPLDESSARRAIDQALAGGAEAIAVCLLFSFRHPAHELRVGELIDELAPALHYSLSHQAVGTFREYERLATTVLDAALGPPLAGYLSRLETRAAAEGLPAPQVMLSSGGTVPAKVAAGNAAATVLSGPAGGTVGAARSADRLGAKHAIAFDMGGTSTDVSLVDHGSVALATGRSIADRPIALPAVDVTTVGAGGGSIAWRDAGGALRVGPQSAGAMPGPAAYGHGGREATVTDANLLLGNLSADSPLAGGLRLDAEAAEAALERLGESLGMSARETALGVIEIANLEMLRAITSITVARGIDPRDHALVAFGGAGPMHGAAIAEALEINTVICPAACGVLSAWGMSVSDLRRDISRSVVRPLSTIDRAELKALEAELAATALADLGDVAESPQIASTYDLRYVGQSFELPVTGTEFDSLAEAFHETHEARFGFADRAAAVELVTLRVSVSLPREIASSRPVRSARPIDGPGTLQLAHATIVVPPGWAAEDLDGDIVLKREAGR